MGFITLVIIYLFASKIAQYVGEPELVILIKYSSLIFLLQSIGSVYNSILKKELEYNLFTKIQIVQLITQKGSMIYFAFMGIGALSFPLGSIIGNLIANILLVTIFLKRRIWYPKLQFSLKCLTSYFKFGISVSLNSMLNNLSYYLDELIISYAFSVETLGLYSFVKNIFNNIIRIVDSTISQVMFPVFSKIQSYDKEFSSAILRLLSCVSLIIIPASFGLSITSSLFVPVFFGSEWFGTIPLFNFMCLWAIFHLTASILVGPLYGKGKSDVVLLVTIADIPIRFLVLTIFSYFGLNIFILALSLLPLFKLFIYMSQIKKITKIPIIHAIKGLKGVYVAAIIASLFGILLKFVLINVLGELYTLLLIVTCVVVLYSILVYYLDKDLITYVLRLIRRVFNRDRLKNKAK
ncbi:hypothetical protein CHI08_02350 [Peribacillus simplex]|nr:hypothetical protein CHI08_02350 [Peribacillus simplex]